jgi:putative ABC transport system permease protein
VLSNYIAAAIRNLLRNWTHAAINLFGLALGFAAALLIALFVRDEYTYDRFFPGYRDVYLLTPTRDPIDRRLLAERWDFSLPDLAAKLSVQSPQIATAARIMTADNPPHIRHGQVEADETGFLWVDPSFFRVMPLKSLAGDLQTALATPDSVVLTRTAARKYFGRDKPLGEMFEVNPAMGSDAAKVSTAFNTSHPMRITAIIDDLPTNSYVKGDVFGSSLAAYSAFALYDLTADQGPFRTQSNYTFIRLRPGTPVQQMQQALSKFGHIDCLSAWVHHWTASDAYWRITPVTFWHITDIPQRRQDASCCPHRHCRLDHHLGIIQFRHADDCSSSPARH